MRHRGVVLLALLALIGVGALFLFVIQLNSSSARLAAEQRTSDALAQAKEALIGRAAGDANHPGSLPCPNTNGNGTAPIFLSNECPSYVGRLPWRTLRLQELRDASGEHLWYALSRSLRDDDSAEPINSATAADFTVDATSQIAAIIFAPGPPTAAQTARPSNVASDYLDGGNADGNNNYTTGPLASGFNDRMIWITRDELFRLVGKRVLAELRGSASGSGLFKYATTNGHYPWASTDGDLEQDSGALLGMVPIEEEDLSFGEETKKWLKDNDWPALVIYTVSPDRTTMTLNLNGVTITCTLASCS